MLKTKFKAKVIGDNESLERIGKDYICERFLQQLRKVEALKRCCVCPSVHPQVLSMKQLHGFIFLLLEIYSKLSS
jgi:hypothetical protein